MSDNRHYGWAECFDCRHRWYVMLEPWESVDWIDCPECGEQGRMVKYVTPEVRAHVNREISMDDKTGEALDEIITAAVRRMERTR